MNQVPPLLTEGDRVRVVAPSGPFEPRRFELGVKALRQRGLTPVFGDGVASRLRYLAGDDKRRLGELHEALADTSARAVWCARGGYGATRLLPVIDRKRVVSHPKWLVGFSDATALHALWQREGVISLHGPNVDTLESWSPEAKEGIWSWLFTGSGPKLRGRAVAGSGIAKGPLLGGNLTVLAAMAGGGALPSFAGAILFIEDVGERPYRLDRSLTCLLQSGALDGVAGVAIGQLTRCDEPPRTSSEGIPEVTDWGALEVLLEVIGNGLDVPVVAALPVGHEPTSFPIPLGATATLDADAGTLSVRLRDP